MIRTKLIYGIAAAGILTVSACSSSSKSSSLSTASSPTTAASSSPTTAAPPVTVSAATVPGLGTVLVNGSGMTLYVLTSEKGGKITCTDATGCTKIWPDNELPKGTTAAIAGAGVQSSLLGTANGATPGDLYASYNSYPLYTFSQDSKAGDAHGEGIKSFGGTWYAMTPAGTLVTSTTTAPSSGGGY